MSLDSYDPAKFRILVERIELEDLKRRKWYLQHKDELIKNVESINDNLNHYTHEHVARKRLEPCMVELGKHYAMCAVNRRRKSRNETSLNYFLRKSELPQESNMKPPEPQESNILYQHGGGRIAYLNIRKRKIPEEKYISCETSNIYGWRLEENSIKSHAPEYKYYASFHHDITRRSGVYVDPPHYTKPMPVTYAKCLRIE